MLIAYDITTSNTRKDLFILSKVKIGNDFVSDDVDRLVFQDESVNPNMCCHKRMDLNMVYQSRLLLNGQRSGFIV
jgi:hypothetical protein